MEHLELLFTMPFTSQNIERGVNTYKGDVYKDVGDLVDACITGQKCLDEARPELNEMMAKVQMDIRGNYILRSYYIS